MNANVPATTVWRVTNDDKTHIEVKVYDKSTGRRVVNARAVMLAKRGETIKMISNKYPWYVFEVRSD